MAKLSASRDVLATRAPGPREESHTIGKGLNHTASSDPGTPIKGGKHQNHLRKTRKALRKAGSESSSRHSHVSLPLLPDSGLPSSSAAPRMRSQLKVTQKAHHYRDSVHKIGRSMVAMETEDSSEIAHRAVTCAYAVFIGTQIPKN